MERIQLVYVAGPYRGATSFDIKQNIRRADIAGEHVVRMGGYSVIPHKNTEHYEGLQGEQFFVDGTKELMLRCDALLVIPGWPWQDSAGTTGEVAAANEAGIPVFFTYADLQDWLNGEEEARPTILQRIRRHFA